MRRMMLILAIGLAAAQSAAAQDASSGARIAGRWCAACHLVGPQQTASDAVPSFYAIAQAPSTTQESLALFLSRKHPPMPDFALTRTETADVSAYILSLRAAR